MDKSIKEMDLNTLITKVLADPNFRADISNKYRVTGYHGINGFEVEQCKPCVFTKETRWQMMISMHLIY